MNRFALSALISVVVAMHLGAAEKVSDIHTNFYVRLPAEKREFPEPLLAGTEPGFAIRGTKGWAWTPEQYLAEIPFIARVKLNFLMNCYISMFDIEHLEKLAGRLDREFPDRYEATRKTLKDDIHAVKQKLAVKYL